MTALQKAPPSGAALPLPIATARALLCTFCILVPVLFWNGLPTAVAIKQYIGQSLVLLASIPVFIAMFVTGKASLPPSPIAAGALLYCLFITINSALHRYSDATVLQGALLSFLLFFEVMAVAKFHEVIRPMLGCLCAGGGIVGGYYALQNLGLDIVSWQLPAADWKGSTFSTRNLMFCFLVCVLPFGLYFLQTGSRRSRIFAGIATAFMLYALLVCRSRIGVLILILSIPAYLHYAAANTRSKRCGSILRILCTCSLMLIAAAAGMLVYFAATLSPEKLNEFSHARMQLWSDTARLIADAPVFGHGAGSFARLFPAYKSEALFYQLPHEPAVFFSHNEMLEILVESGAVGFTLFTISIIICLIPLFRAGLINILNTPLLFFSCVSLGGAYIFSLVGEACHMFICSSFAWIALAICTSQAADIPRPLQPGSPILFQLIGIFWGVGVAVALVFLARSFLSEFHLQQAIVSISQSGQNADPVNALSHIERSLRFNRDNLQARYQLAYVKTARREFQEALALYEGIQERSPYFENIQHNKGAIYLYQKNYRRAIDTLTAAHHRYPTALNTLQCLAGACFKLGDWPACDRWCTVYRQIDSTNVQINMMAVWTERVKNTHVR